MHASTGAGCHVTKKQVVAVLVLGTKHVPWLGTQRNLGLCTDNNSYTSLETLISTLRVVDGHRATSPADTNLAMAAGNLAASNRPYDDCKRCKHRHLNRECFKQHPELVFVPKGERYLSQKIMGKGKEKGKANVVSNVDSDNESDSEDGVAVAATPPSFSNTHIISHHILDCLTKLEASSFVFELRVHGSENNLSELADSRNTYHKKINFFNRRRNDNYKRKGKAIDRRQTFDPEYVLQTQRENEELYSLVTTLQEQISQQDGKKTEKNQSKRKSNQFAQHIRRNSPASFSIKFENKSSGSSVVEDERNSREPRRRNSSSSQPRPHRSHSHRIPDLSEKLDNGSNPTYDASDLMLEDNLETYASHWNTERQRMNYVFRQTKGLAQGYLIQRMKLDHSQFFTCLDDMLPWLASFFKNPNKKETARVAYRNCRMSSNETFNNLYSRFSKLLSKARIDPSDVLSDLFHKLSPEVYNLSISLMAKNPPLPVAIKRFQFYDNKLRLNRPVTNTTRPATKLSDFNKPQFTLTGTSSPQ
ncbi:hypothetical protein K3495_g7875 [Podosphaera aphanis]|nr:hypothetical protein K3495_g7875 [Podosphaera aphanis]